MCYSPEAMHFRDGYNEVQQMANSLPGSQMTRDFDSQSLVPGSRPTSGNADDSQTRMTKAAVLCIPWFLHDYMIVDNA